MDMSLAVRVVAIAALVALGGCEFSKASKHVEPAAPVVVSASFLVSQARAGDVQQPRTRLPKVATTDKWTFYYSCSAVRIYATIFSKDQLEAMRVKFKKPRPTAKEMQQIVACIAGRAY